MLLYGLVVISSIDNIVKPYLISRSSSLPTSLYIWVSSPEGGSLCDGANDMPQYYEGGLGSFALFVNVV